MIVDCAHYLDGRRQDVGAIAPEEAALRCGRGGFVWLGMVEPEPGELEQVRRSFGLHELAVEDAQSYHLRPKLEQYEGDVHFVILRTARYDAEREEVEFGEISIFVGPSFVITVRQGIASDLHGARLRLEDHPDLLATGTAAVLWAILDKVVDDYTPVVEGLERDIEEVEKTVFAGAVAPTERIYSLRREVTDFYRAVHPLLAPLEGVERGAIADVAPELRPYFRDVHDHLRLVNEEVTAQRDLLATCLEANLAVISVEQTNLSVRQNDSIKQLTILATVFLPLTFVTGFFGQNFGWLVGHVNSAWDFVVFGIGGLLLPCVVLYAWLRRTNSL
jgi:magnesium transporter